MSDICLSQSQIYVWRGKQKQWTLASEDTCLLPPGRHIVRQTPQLARSGIRTVNEGFSQCAANRIPVLYIVGNTLSPELRYSLPPMCASVPDTSSLWL